MKKKDIQIGQAVEVRQMPFTGRIGKVRGFTRVLGVKFVEVWCDEVDKNGRHVVRVKAKHLVPFLGAPV